MAQQKKKNNGFVTAAKVGGVIAAGGAAGYLGAKYMRNRGIKKAVSGVGKIADNITFKPLPKRQENSLNVQARKNIFQQAGNTRDSVIAANKAKYSAIRQQRAADAVSMGKRIANTVKVQQRRDLLQKSGALTQIQKAKAASKQSHSIRGDMKKEKSLYSFRKQFTSGTRADQDQLKKQRGVIKNMGKQASGLNRQSYAARQQAKQRISKIVASQGGYSGRVGGKQGTGNYSINIYTLYDF